MKKIVFLIALSMSCVLHAQVAIVPGGGDGTNMSFTIGEAISCSASGNEGAFEAGVQQTYTLVVTKLHNVVNTLNASVRVYPNPTSAMLCIELIPAERGAAEYRIVNINGQTADKGVLDTEKAAVVDLSPYPVGNYTIEIKKQGKTFSCMVIKK